VEVVVEEVVEVVEEVVVVVEQWWRRWCVYNELFLVQEIFWWSNGNRMAGDHKPKLKGG
jgi:hypothetical protein